jgi:hypothetical protein
MDSCEEVKEWECTENTVIAESLTKVSKDEVDWKFHTDIKLLDTKVTININSEPTNSKNKNELRPTISRGMD